VTVEDCVDKIPNRFELVLVDEPKARVVLNDAVDQVIMMARLHRNLHSAPQAPFPATKPPPPAGQCRSQPILAAGITSHTARCHAVQLVREGDPIETEQEGPPSLPAMRPLLRHHFFLIVKLGNADHHRLLWWSLYQLEANNKSCRGKLGA
jgi:DNA-directed RNA polymerase omega subunit